MREKNHDYSVLAYVPNILPEPLLTELVHACEHLSFYEGTTEKGATIDRQQIWFQNEGHYFCKRWEKRYPRWEAHAYPHILKQVETYLQDHLHELTELHPSVQPITLNSCLLNWYRDGNQFIPPHRDSAISFGEHPTILGISLGAERTLRLTRRGDSQEYKLRLAHNSLFMMAGATQKYYLHEIPKEPECHEERWSLTFRQYIDHMDHEEYTHTGETA